MFLFPAAANARQEQWQVGTTPSFLSGTYGSDTRTDIVYTPITARRLFRDGDLILVLPFTCIRGSGAVTVVNGTAVRSERGPTETTAGAVPGPVRGADTHAPAETFRDGTGAELQVAGTAATGTVNTCGVGDVIVRGRYYIVDQRGWMPTVSVRAHLKLPTASAERGLGTGRPDEGLGVEVSRLLPGGLLAMVDGGFTVIGQPEGVEYDNAWWYDVGLARSFAGGAVSLSVFFEEYRAIVPGLPNARDVLAVVSVRNAGGWRLQGAALVGLSDGSPDHGITLGASRRF